MTRMLLVQDDPAFRDVISGHLRRSNASDELEYAMTGMLGARKLAACRYDIAMINVTLPDTSGLELARLAANENVCVLMLSENRVISQELDRLDYRYLEKPFSSDLLLSESKRVVLDSTRRMSRMKSSATILHSNLRALQVEIDHANQLFDAIVAKLGYLH